MTSQSDGGSIEAAALPAAALSPFEPQGGVSGARLAIDDEELGILMKHKAMPIALAAIFWGLFFGTAMQAGEALSASLLRAEPVDPEAVLYLVVASLSLGFGLSAMMVVLRRRSQVFQVLEAIRRRSRGNGGAKRQ